MKKWMSIPYPFLLGNLINRLKVTSFVLVFVFFFLIIFEPFEIQKLTTLTVTECALLYGFTAGLTSFIGISLLIKLNPKYANDQSWNVGKEILMMISILLLVSLANFIVSVGLEIYPDRGASNAELSWLAVSRTFSVGIFPVTLITFLNYTIMLKRNLTKAEQHNLSIAHREPEVMIKMPTVVTLTSTSKNNDIEVDLEQLIFIMSDGNYVEFHLQRDGKLSREIRRNTLNSIDKQLKSYPFIFRTHRAFMVNLSKVEKSTGNAQGYQLKLANTETLIPVSRSKLADFDLIFASEQQLAEQYSS